MSAIIWAVVAGAFLWRLDRFAYAWLALRDPKAHEPEVVVIPDDLEALALDENAPWAQEQVRETIRERFAALKNWNLVRRAVGIGEIDA